MEDLTGHVVVVSPHLDDAVFSLGGTISRVARSGGQVEVLTVFACDPSSSAPPSGWDSRAGFSTEGEAARARRAEDGLACRLVGAHPTWLAFKTGSYTPDKDAHAVWEEIADTITAADAVLVPGFPLSNPDHAWIAELAVARRSECARVGLYAEQPYRDMAGANTGQLELPARLAEIVGGPVEWTTSRCRIADRLRKRRAISAYASQLPLLGLGRGRKLDLLLIREALYRHEAVAWLPDNVTGHLHSRTTAALT